jgi:hypothetical protein
MYNKMALIRRLASDITDLADPYLTSLLKFVSRSRCGLGCDTRSIPTFRRCMLPLSFAIEEYAKKQAILQI